MAKPYLYSARADRRFYRGPAEAVGYAISYWQSGEYCTPSLALLRVCLYGF